ncbi:MAG: hypothetical protein NTW87_02290 [Planctomycetota bacterium]|nr:hypothetical protein [Planctomycetota bacterium]
MSEEAKVTVDAQRKRIAEEVGKLGPDHPWAGSYYFGDGLGVNSALDLAPDAGFVFEWHGCMGVYDRNHGSMAIEDGHIKLKCLFTNRQDGFRGIAVDLLPIGWGTRHYLVPAEKLPDFCNAINSGDEPRKDMHGMFFLRRGDEARKVEGAPVLPQEFRAYLLTTPLRAEIAKVEEPTYKQSRADFKFRLTPVALNVGKVEGVFKGMEFYVLEGDAVMSAKVTEVEEHTCKALFTDMDDEKLRPTVGWKVSTRPRWRE